MNIRRAVPEDAEAISALIMGLAQHFLLEPSERGRGAFLQA